MRRTNTHARVKPAILVLALLFLLSAVGFALSVGGLLPKSRVSAVTAGETQRLTADFKEFSDAKLATKPGGYDYVIPLSKYYADTVTVSASGGVWDPSPYAHLINGTYNYVFTIGSARELMLFSNLCNDKVYSTVSENADGKIVGVGQTAGPSSFLLAANYILTNNIDASTLTGGAEGYFYPVGFAAAPFTGTFDGQNFEIWDLPINKFLSTLNPNNKYKTMFSYNAGTLKNFGLNGLLIDVTGSTTKATDVCSPLVGENKGRVQHVYVRTAAYKSDTAFAAGSVTTELCADNTDGSVSDYYTNRIGTITPDGKKSLKNAAVSAPGNGWYSGSSVVFKKLNDTFNFTGWNVDTFTDPRLCGMKTGADSAYEISQPADLVYFSFAYSSGAFNGKTFRITADLDMRLVDEEAFFSGLSFTGKLTGKVTEDATKKAYENQPSIIGLKLVPLYGITGMFSGGLGNIEISQLNVVGGEAILPTAQNSVYAGFFVSRFSSGTNYSVTLSNVFSSANVGGRSVNTAASTLKAGGLIGSLEGSVAADFQNVYVCGNVYGGVSSTTGSGCAVGGIAGELSSISRLSEVGFSGGVTGISASGGSGFAGGFFGSAAFSDSLTIAEGNSMSGTVAGGNGGVTSYLGGLFGKFNNAAGTFPKLWGGGGVMSGSVRGADAGEVYMGGIAGLISGGGMAGSAAEPLKTSALFGKQNWLALPSSSALTAYAGNLAGGIQGSAVRYVTNDFAPAITVSSVTELSLAGISGSDSSAGTSSTSYENCLNTAEFGGAISLGSGEYSVSGLTSGSSNSVFTDCVNSGKFAPSATAQSNVYVAGLTKLYLRLLRCENRGDLYAPFLNNTAYAAGLASGPAGNVSYLSEVSSCANYGTIGISDPGAGVTSGTIRLAGLVQGVRGDYMGAGGGLRSSVNYGEIGTVTLLASGEKVYSLPLGGQLRIGGLAYQATVIEYCANLGNLYHNSDITKGGGCNTAFIGGLTAEGYSYNYGGVKNAYYVDSINAGDILIGGNISTYGPDKNVGGICGETFRNNMTIRNCINLGDIKIDTTGSVNKMYVGGITGHHIASGGIVENTVNRGTISVSASSYANISAGGFAGFANENPVEIRAGLNYGSVTGNSASGFIASFSGKALTIDGAANYGNINGTVAAGGIIGSAAPKESGGSIKTCVNYGVIRSSGNSTGGIAGSMSNMQVEEAAILHVNFQTEGTKATVGAGQTGIGKFYDNAETLYATDWNSADDFSAAPPALAPTLVWSNQSSRASDVDSAGNLLYPNLANRTVGGKAGNYVLALTGVYGRSEGIYLGGLLGPCHYKDGIKPFLDGTKVSIAELDNKISATQQIGISRDFFVRGYEYPQGFVYFGDTAADGEEVWDASTGYPYKKLWFPAAEFFYDMRVADKKVNSIISQVTPNSAYYKEYFQSAGGVFDGGNVVLKQPQLSELAHLFSGGTAKLTEISRNTQTFDGSNWGTVVYEVQYTLTQRPFADVLNGTSAGIVDPDGLYSKQVGIYVVFVDAAPSAAINSATLDTAAGTANATLAADKTSATFAADQAAKWNDSMLTVELAVKNMEGQQGINAATIELFRKTGGAESKVEATLNSLAYWETVFREYISDGTASGDYIEVGGVKIYMSQGTATFKTQLTGSYYWTGTQTTTVYREIPSGDYVLRITLLESYTIDINFTKEKSGDNGLYVDRYGNKVGNIAYHLLNSQTDREYKNLTNTTTIEFEFPFSALPDFARMTAADALKLFENLLIYQNTLDAAQKAVCSVQDLTTEYIGDGAQVKFTLRVLITPENGRAADAKQYVFVFTEEMPYGRVTIDGNQNDVTVTRNDLAADKSYQVAFGGSNVSFKRAELTWEGSKFADYANGTVTPAAVAGLTPPTVTGTGAVLTAVYAKSTSGGTYVYTFIYGYSGDEQKVPVWKTGVQGTDLTIARKDVSASRSITKTASNACYLDEVGYSAKPSSLRFAYQSGANRLDGAAPDYVPGSDYYRTNYQSAGGTALSIDPADPNRVKGVVFYPTYADIDVAFASFQTTIYFKLYLDGQNAKIDEYAKIYLLTDSGETELTREEVRDGGGTLLYYRYKATLPELEVMTFRVRAENPAYYTDYTFYSMGPLRNKTFLVRADFPADAEGLFVFSVMRVNAAGKVANASSLVVLPNGNDSPYTVNRNMAGTYRFLAKLPPGYRVKSIAYSGGGGGSGELNLSDPSLTIDGDNPVTYEIIFTVEKIPDYVPPWGIWGES